MKFNFYVFVCMRSQKEENFLAKFPIIWLHFSSSFYKNISHFNAEKEQTWFIFPWHSNLESEITQKA